jgi:integrase
MYGKGAAKMANKRKRGQGEGMIRQRADGRWEANISLGWKNGKRHRVSYYGRTRQEVQLALNKALHNKEHGLPVGIDKRLTVSAFLTEWLETSVRPAVAPRTYESYELTVRLHLAPNIGHVRLHQLSAQGVQRLLNAKRETGLSARTVAYMRVVLRTALKQAMEWDLVARNVAAMAKPPKAESPKFAILSADGARSLLEAAKSDRLGAIFSVAIACGLRKGEILGLRWSDVDLQARKLSVRQSVQRLSRKLTGEATGSLRAAEPKTKSSIRTITIPDSIVALLRAHRVRQIEARLIAGSQWKESGLVFTSVVGTAIDPSIVNSHLKSVLAKAGLPAIRFHDLRHSAASFMVDQGVHLRAVMAVLGHSSIRITADTYAHPSEDMMRSAADSMESILATPPETLPSVRPAS